MPFEVIEREGNLLMYGGVSSLWHRLLGGTSVQPFDSANARIGVGDGNAAADPVQTDLQGANKIRKGMDATFPQHADGVNAAANTVTFKATFTTAEANFVWNEWGLFNAGAGGRMLNARSRTSGRRPARRAGRSRCS